MGAMEEMAEVILPVRQDQDELGECQTLLALLEAGEVKECVIMKFNSLL